MQTLVVIPCGKRKIWSMNPNAGPTAAKDAYIGAPFVVNREYTEASGHTWVVLSAKYGFLTPVTLVEDYDVTFKKRSTRPITVSALRAQVADRGLVKFSRVIALGGIDYVMPLRQAFAGTGAIIEWPVEGLRAGEKMRKVKQMTRQRVF